MGAVVPFPTDRATPSRSPRAPRQAGPPPDLRVSWREHYGYLDRNWEPGQHVSVIAPTGRGGKSYLITRGLLPLWRESRVLYIDVKDFDATLQDFGHKVGSFPGLLRQAAAPHPAWFRLHVPSALGGGGSLEQQRRTIYDALAGAYRQRKWLIVGDELSFLYDDLNLKQPLRDLWKRGRSHVTFIAATQEPKWVPSAMYSQPSMLYLGRLDAEGNKRLGEIGGTVDYREVRDILGTVREHEFLFIDKVRESAPGRPLMQIVKVGR